MSDTKGSNLKNISVRPLKSDDVSAVVQIHLKAFPGFFLSFLGRRFLYVFYSSFLVDPQGLGYVAVSGDGGVLGVVVGPLMPVGYFGRLLRRRWWAFCVASVSSVLRKPSVLPRLFRAVVYRGDPPAGNDRALLSSIAIIPDGQGNGVGRILVAHWLKNVRERGGRGAYLTTDAHGNDRVNAFYRGSGWTLDATYLTAAGRIMNRYVIDF